MAGTLFLDDLHVGQRFAAGPLTVTDKDIVSFATVFDPQPFHLDAEAAKATLFKGLVASGWHTAALTMRLLTEGGMPISTGIIGVGGEIAWPHRCGRGTNFGSKAKSWKSTRRDLSRTRQSSRCAAGRAIRTARPCRS
jgi:hypothetical protein